jgi:hypothetical protein
MFVFGAAAEHSVRRCARVSEHERRAPTQEPLASATAPAWAAPAARGNAITRTAWRILDALDYCVTVVVYLLVPRDTRERWFMPGTQVRNQSASREVFGLLDPSGRARVLDVGGGEGVLTPILQEDPRVRTAEIKRVSRKGIVIHGPAGDGAIELSKRFIAALSERGLRVPRYACEHLEFSMPMPAWFHQTFPGCQLAPRRNLEVEMATLMTEYTPLLRWLSGYRYRRLMADDDRPPFVEYTMTWRKAS